MKLSTRLLPVLVLGLFSLTAASQWSEEGESWKDKSTGLLWTRTDSGEPGNWSSADGYCKFLSTQGRHAGWRLPTPEELGTIWQGSHFKDDIQLRPTAKLLWTAMQMGDKAMIFIPHATGADMRLLPKTDTKPVALCVRKPSLFEW